LDHRNKSYNASSDNAQAPPSNEHYNDAKPSGGPPINSEGGGNLDLGKIATLLLQAKLKSEKKDAESQAARKLQEKEYKKKAQYSKYLSNIKAGVSHVGKDVEKMTEGFNSQKFKTYTENILSKVRVVKKSKRTNELFRQLQESLKKSEQLRGFNRDQDSKSISVEEINPGITAPNTTSLSLEDLWTKRVQRKDQRILTAVRKAAKEKRLRERVAYLWAKVRLISKYVCFFPAVCEFFYFRYIKNREIIEQFLEKNVKACKIELTNQLWAPIQRNVTRLWNICNELCPIYDEKFIQRLDFDPQTDKQQFLKLVEAFQPDTET
jgi:hypothetical protein